MYGKFIHLIKNTFLNTINLAYFIQQDILLSSNFDFMYNDSIITLQKYTALCARDIS